MSTLKASAPPVLPQGYWIKDEDFVPDSLLVWRDPTRFIEQPILADGREGYADHKVIQANQNISSTLFNARDRIVNAFREITLLGEIMPKWIEKYPTIPAAGMRKKAYELQMQASAFAKSGKESMAAALGELRAIKEKEQAFKVSIQKQIEVDTAFRTSQPGFSEWLISLSWHDRPEGHAAQDAYMLQKYRSLHRFNEVQRELQSLLQKPSNLSPAMEPWIVLCNTIHENLSAVHAVLSDRDGPLLMNKDRYTALMAVKWEPIADSFGYFADFLGNRNEDLRA